MKKLIPVFLLSLASTWALAQVGLEDFENGPALDWAPFGQQAVLHGSFEVADNPGPDAVNPSAKSGHYTKGFSAFSTLTATMPVNLALYPQFNLDVWQLGGSLSVTVQLKSPSAGTQELTRYLLNPMGWETLSFDFTDFIAVNDWTGINLVFNLGTAEEGAEFYFDNLSQNPSTTEPCDGVVPVANIIDDFECQRNYAYGAGANLLTTELNPLPSGENLSSLAGRYTDLPNEPWSALCAEFPDGIDLGSFHQLSIAVLAPEAMAAPIPILMKLEGGTSPAAEAWTEITSPGVWQTRTIDFSAEAGNHHKRACFFFNGGVGQATEDVYFIDNLRFEQSALSRCVMNFEEPSLSSTDWGYFPNGTDGPFSLVNNPVPGGINTSAKVGKAIENANSGQPWQGMYTDLPAPVKFTSDKLVKMKVYAAQATSVTMKLEGPLTPGAPGDSGDNTVPIPSANAWQELVFDFNNSPNPIPPDVEYQRITLIFDLNNIPSSNRTYYFDDIRLNDGDCAAATGLFEPLAVEQLRISPNPVSRALQVENLARISRLEVFDLLGQRLASHWVGNGASTSLDLSALQPGLYLLAGYGPDGGVPVAMSKFVKD